MSEVQVVVPAAVDDPGRPSGGNAYDRRLCRELGAAGWSVTVHRVRGAWPTPTPDDLAGLGGVLSTLPDRAMVLLDGLVASAAADALLPEARRLRLVVLVHQLLADGLPEGPATVPDEEHAVLRAASAVVVTSRWSADRLLRRYPVDPRRVQVAEPGTDPAPLAAPSSSGHRLLCVGVVAPHKGQDVLVTALAATADVEWACVCVGSLERDRPFAQRLARTARDAGIGPRVRFTGVLAGPQLDEQYAESDLLLVPSRSETYGMVAAEALARGIPVLASQVGGLPAILGVGTDTGPAGLLVPPGEPGPFASALHRWLSDDDLRSRLRRRARHRRDELPGWSATAAGVARAIASAV